MPRGREALIDRLDVVLGELTVKVGRTPEIQVHELGDSSVNFIVRPWARTADYLSVFWDITRRVKTRFDEEGISIPYPQQDVHVYHASAPAEPRLVTRKSNETPTKKTTASEPPVDD